MRKWLFVAVIVFGLPFNAAAQLVPHVALFGGYTFVHSKFDNSNLGFSLNGWDGSLEVKPIPFVGLVADVSQQYGSPYGIPERQTMVLFGPQITPPRVGRFVPFVHALAGFVHGTNGQVPGIPELPPRFSTGNAFATALGGGLDVKVLGPLYIRAIQADWLHADLSPDHHTQLRLAAGVVLRFGH